MFNKYFARKNKYKKAIFFQTFNNFFNTTEC